MCLILFQEQCLEGEQQQQKKIQGFNAFYWEDQTVIT